MENRWDGNKCSRLNRRFPERFSVRIGGFGVRSRHECNSPIRCRIAKEQGATGSSLGPNVGVGVFDSYDQRATHRAAYHERVRAGPLESRYDRVVESTFHLTREGESTMLMAVNDPSTVREIRSERSKKGLDKYDEVWDGVIVVMPLPNDEHQDIVTALAIVLAAAIGWPTPHRLRSGINLSDRVKGWKKNYREPDFAVFLDTNPAKNCETHWVGGPDFLVEIVSPDDQTRDKLPFYEKVGTREVLVIDRDPWKLELYKLVEGKLNLIGTAKPGNGKPLPSDVLPVTFSLKAGDPRPKLVVRKVGSSEEWKI